jgi:hypothetical protein
MRNASPKPRVIASTVRSPRRSSADYRHRVPIFTASIVCIGIGGAARQRQKLANACNRGVAVTLGVLRQKLVRRKRAVRPARDDVGERAAAVDPELPACLREISHREGIAWPVRRLGEGSRRGPLYRLLALR